MLEAVSCIPLCDHHLLPLLLWTSYSHVYDDAQGVASVLVGDLGEGMSGQDVLWEQWQSEASWDQLVGPPRKPRRPSGVWGWNWNFKSLKKWKLSSQIR